MLYPRIIPCLLLRNKGLIKTTQFKSSKYIGDPINAVKIFNEKQADELMVLDIDATVKCLEPDYKLIEHLASECRMPLCYGGGIKTVEQAKRIFSLGVEKIALSSIVLERPDFVSEVAAEVGSQSVVAVLDVKKKSENQYEIYSHNGQKKSQLDLVDFVQHLEKLGIGELVLNSIDNDGLMTGYDMNLIKKVKPAISVPFTILGGAGSIEDIKQVITEHKIIGVAAGSIFVFHGKFRAVLISYLSLTDKESMIHEVLNAGAFKSSEYIEYVL